MMGRGRKGGISFPCPSCRGTNLQSWHPSQARYIQIKAELEAVKDVIGVDAAALNQILGNLKGSTYFGGIPQPIEKLLESLFQGPRRQSLPSGEAEDPPPAWYAQPR